MNIENELYIYYNNNEENIKLKDFIIFLEKPQENKNEIIRLFFKKFENDYWC